MRSACDWTCVSIHGSCGNWCVVVWFSTLLLNIRKQSIEQVLLLCTDVRLNENQKGKRFVCFCIFEPTNSIFFFLLFFVSFSLCKLFIELNKVFAFRIEKDSQQRRNETYNVIRMDVNLSFLSSHRFYYFYSANWTVWQRIEWTKKEIERIFE